MSWNDLHQYTPAELKQKYRVDDKGLEKGIRNHWDGSNRQEKIDLYKNVYDNKK